VFYGCFITKNINGSLGKERLYSSLLQPCCFLAKKARRYGHTLKNKGRRGGNVFLQFSKSWWLKSSKMPVPAYHKAGMSDKNTEFGEG
jgi:hypothetical protein